jgi:hypothetical protein
MKILVRVTLRLNVCVCYKVEGCNSGIEPMQYSNNSILDGCEKMNFFVSYTLIFCVLFLQLECVVARGIYVLKFLYSLMFNPSRINSISH